MRYGKQLDRIRFSPRSYFCPARGNRCQEHFPLGLVVVVAVSLGLLALTGKPPQD